MDSALKAISASSNVQLSIRAAPVTAFDAFLGAAEALLTGIQPLAAGVPQTAWPLTFIAGQVVECSLKAYLSKHGVTEKDLKSRAFGHDLAKLWARAAQFGLRYAQESPVWLQRLSELHGGQYAIRYPMSVNAVVLPQVALMAGDLPLLVNAVRSAAI